MNKYIKLYEDFVNENLALNENKEQILAELTELANEHFVVEGELYLDSKNRLCCKGSVVLAPFKKDIAKLPFQWGEVTGNFHITHTTKLRNLEGCPENVGGNFQCRWGSVESLKGGPKYVGGSYFCSTKKLTSLEGAPAEVGEHFDCSFAENLTSLKGAPRKVGGNFSCSSCEKLTSLEGAPKEVGGDFDCNGCIKLTSLKGAPTKIGGRFKVPEGMPTN
jgi:hypothetical protein